MRNTFTMVLLWTLLGILSVASPELVGGAEGPGTAPGEAAVAEGAADGATTSKAPETVFTLVVKGGWLMIPIALCSVVVLTWTIERLISMKRPRVYAPDLIEKIQALIPSRSRIKKRAVDEASALCEESDSIVSRIFAVGVSKLHRDEAHAQAFLEEASVKEVHVLKRKLRPFEVCVAVAPLLGLLGTIFGMISSFEKSTMVETAARADTLASGIYQALVTTASGLCVAIPALLIHHYFLGQIDRVQDTIEESATEFLDFYYGNSSQSRGRKGTSDAKEDSRAPGPEPSEATVESGS